MVSRVILVRLFERWDDAGKPRNLTENKLEISILEAGVYTDQQGWKRAPCVEQGKKSVANFSSFWFVTRNFFLIFVSPD